MVPSGRAFPCRDPSPGWAAAHTIGVPHTPDVLTEETAETMRQFPAADRWRLWSGFLVDNVDAQATGHPLLTLAAECLLVGSKAQ